METRRTIASLMIMGGVIVVQTMLFWGGVALIERSGSAVVRGVLVATLAASLLALWFSFWFGLGILEGGYQAD